MTQKFDEPDAEIPDGLWLMALESSLRVRTTQMNDAALAPQALRVPESYP